MGKSAPKPPPGPDINQLVKTQADVNRVDQFSPFGSSVFSGPNKTTQTTTLAPGQQQLFDLATQLGGQLPSQPFSFDFDRAGTENAVFQRGLNLLNPEFERQERSLEQRLANQGLPTGSEAFNDEFTRFQSGRDTALENLAFRSVEAGGAEESRALSNQLLGRQQPLSEIGGLLSLIRAPGAQPSQVDVLGPAQLQQNAQLAAFNAQNQQQQGLLGGLFGLGGALGSAAILSSRDFKEDDAPPEAFLDRVRKLPIRAWRYKGEAEMHIGPYAEDWARLFGGNGKFISAIDAIGVCLKAIQELAGKMEAAHGN
jgi:hypothetical protein